jgi:RHS repeat-associated protein
MEVIVGEVIGHEEGRTRWAYHKYTTGTTAYKFEYDFFERDHLGNTRTVLTQERNTTNYLATMEYQYRVTELQLFGNILSTDTAWTAMPNYTNIPNNIRYMYTSPNDSVSKVDSSSAGGQKVGPNLLLKVMSGDTVSLSVQCYYVSPGGGSTNNSSFSDVLTSLSNGLVNLTGGEHGTFANLTASNSTVYTGLTSFLSTDDTAHTGYPKAYINWIFLDDQFNYVSSLSGSVLAASATYPAGSMNFVAPGGPIALNKSGYLYIWVSNETTGWDVYYDNLSVQYKQGPLLEENHYYPFGLTMAGISDKAIKTNYVENKYRYDAGTELQNKEFSDGTGLEYYDAGFRRLDPQLGRFSQIDPMASANAFASTYQYSLNNPILFADPSGCFQQYSPPNFITNPTVTPFGPNLNMDANEGDYFDFVPAGGGSGIFGDGSSDDASSGLPPILTGAAAAYVAQLYSFGINPSPNDPYLCQLILEGTWGNQVSISGVSLNSDGSFQVSGTTQNGNPLDYHVGKDFVSSFISQYNDTYGVSEGSFGNGLEKAGALMFAGGPGDGQGGNNSSSGPLLRFVGLRNGFIPEFETSLLDNKGAMTPGPFVLYPTGGSSDPYYNTHEPGHVLQFYLLGANPLLYNTLIAIPSLIQAAVLPPEQAAQMPSEISATSLWYWYSGQQSPSNPHR